MYAELRTFHDGVLVECNVISHARTTHLVSGINIFISILIMKVSYKKTFINWKMYHQSIWLSPYNYHNLLLMMEAENIDKSDEMMNQTKNYLTRFFTISLQTLIIIKSMYDIDRTKSRMIKDRDTVIRMEDHSLPRMSK